MSDQEDSEPSQLDIQDCALGVWNYLMEGGQAGIEAIREQCETLGYGPAVADAAVAHLANKNLITGPYSGPCKIKNEARRRYARTGPPL